MSVFGKLSWYFVGYERQIAIDENGKKMKSRLVYIGRYYQLGQTKKERICIKTVSGLLAAVLTAIYLCSSLSDSYRTAAPYVSVVYLIALLPMIYLWLSMAYLIFSKEKMTYRMMVGSNRRCHHSCVFLLIFFLLTLVLQIVNLCVQNKLGILHSREWYFLGEDILCILLSLAILLWNDKKKPKLIPQTY